MGKFNVKPESVLRSKILTPGAYLLLITGVEEKTEQKDQSLTTIVHFEGQEGESKGVPLQLRLNEKYDFAAIPFIRAMGGKVDESKGASFELTNDTLKGKKVIGMVINTEDKGRTYNNLSDFRPAPTK